MPKKPKQKRDPQKNDELDEFRDVTVAEMNVEGMRWYKTPAEKKRAEEMDSLNLSKSERRAIIKGAYAALMPAFLIGLLVFCAAFGLLMLLFYFWGK